MRNTLIVVLGPTGVGKTAISLQLAQQFHLPVINADSRQIFKELPIGTAAPSHEELQRVQHYFVGQLQLTDYYSASLFEQDVMNLLKQLFNTPSVPPAAILSGGSMLYIDAVCNGIDDIPTVDDSTRALYKERLETEGLPALVEELRQRDPEHWKIVDKCNPRRVLHALEICRITGKTYTSFRTRAKKQRPFNILKIGLNLPRDILYERINQRVIHMMEQGLEDEARSVYSFKGVNALNTVGYKELFAYFEGRIDKAEAVRQIQSNTREYMRKQLTWFKKDPTIHWFSPEDYTDIATLVDQHFAKVASLHS